MKKAILLIVFFCVAVISVPAQEIDVTKKPDPLPETSFKFPDHTEKMLSNGLKLFIVQDNEQPTVSIRLLIKGGSSMDGDKAGLADLVAGMLTKGAGDMTALQIAQKIDGVGADLSASAGVDYMTVSGFSLTKHLDLMLEVFSDVLQKPTFPEEEFEKMVSQTLAAIKNEKSSPNSLAAAMTRKVIYGADHPYGAKTTEESVNSTNIDDLKKFYSTWFKPNNATLAVVGDVNVNDIVAKLETVLKDWKKAPVPKIKVPKPEPMPLGVYFVERPASVQSAISVATPTVSYDHRDFETISIAARIMGGGFAGRLFKTLREKHSYTYSPWGYQTSSKFANRFACGSDVRNDVTDSSIIVIKEQLADLNNNAPSEQELYRIKKYTVGSYQMSFESSGYIASLIQNADFYGTPMKQVKTYPQRIMKMNGNDIKKVANQYMNTDNSYIIVVGAPEVKESLEKFGKVYTYDLDLVSEDDKKKEEVSLSAEEIIEKYTKAIGGNEAIERIKTIKATGDISLSAGPQSFKGTSVEYQKTPNKKYMKIDIGVMVLEDWCDGQKVFKKQGPLTEIKGAELAEMLLEYEMFMITKIFKLGFKAEVKGSVDGIIQMDITSPSGNPRSLFFDSKTFYLTKISQVTNSPQGQMAVEYTLNNYKDFGGVKLPTVSKTTSPMFSMEATVTYSINEEVDDAMFVPSTK